MSLNGSAYPKRSSNELVNRVIRAALPCVPHVTEGMTAHLLVVMATFTNPNRDQILGVAREWQCGASVPTLAKLARMTDRQVRRALAVLRDKGYIETDPDANTSGPGRPRKGEAPARGRANTWYLRPDLWPLEEIPVPQDRFIETPVLEDRNNGKLEKHLSPGTGPRSYRTDFPEKHLSTGTDSISEKSVLQDSQTQSTVNSEYVENSSFGLELSRAPAREGVPPGEDSSIALKAEDAAYAQAPLGRMLTRVPVPRCSSCGVGMTDPAPGACTIPAFHGPPKRKPRCIKCKARQNEPPAPGCHNHAWHDLPLVEVEHTQAVVNG